MYQAFWLSIAVLPPMYQSLALTFSRKRTQKMLKLSSLEDTKG